MGAPLAQTWRRNAARELRCSRQHSEDQRCVVPLPRRACQRAKPCFLFACAQNTRWRDSLRAFTFDLLTDSFVKYDTRHEKGPGVNVRCPSGRSVPRKIQMDAEGLQQATDHGRENSTSPLAYQSYGAAFQMLFSSLTLLRKSHLVTPTPPCMQHNTREPVMDSFCLSHTRVSAGTSITCSVRSVGKYCMQSPFGSRKLLASGCSRPGRPQQARPGRGHSESPTGVEFVSVGRCPSAPHLP